MEEKIQALYEEINFLGFNATYNRNNNYVDISKSLFPKVQEFVQWFLEQPFGFETEVYENLIGILRDCEMAVKEHDNVLMMDALEQGVSGYLEMFLSEDYFKEKEKSCVNEVKG